MHIVSVNTARAAPRLINDREVLTGIGKRPRQGPVEVTRMGLEGDEQADLSVHGGLSKAVYAYPLAHYPFWRTVRAQARVDAWDAELLPPGSMGENLTLEGLTERELWVGDRLVFEHGTVLAVSEPRFPCFKFNAVMGFAKAAKLMVESGYCGAYLGVIEAATLRAGESFTVEPGPRDVNIVDIFRSRTAGKRF